MADATVTTIVAYAKDLAQTRRFYERALGLRPLGVHASWARYSAGLADIEIRAAAGAGVQIEDGVDESALMVFLVEDIDDMRSALEARGVEFQPTLRYEIGATAACFDPDGHNITLYEPSAEAMTWPSAAKIEAIAAASAERGSGSASGGGLDGAPLVYLFLFVRGTAQAAAFYGGALQLPILEQDDDAGVVKYDGGTVILATHVVGGDAYCAVEMDLSRAKRISPLLEVRDADAIVQRLARAGIPAAGSAAPRDDGSVVVFEDPNGHRFRLRSSMRKRREDAPLHVH